MSVGVLLLTEDGTGVALQHHVHRAGGDEMLNFNTLTINNEMVFLLGFAAQQNFGGQFESLEQGLFLLTA